MPTPQPIVVTEPRERASTDLISCCSTDTAPSSLDEEREALLARVMDLTEQLENEREIRLELETAKRALVSEVEELSQVLFEEAGSMVAKEARARAAIESSRVRLEAELKDTRDRLEYQSAQLEVLRTRLHSMSISAIDADSDGHNTNSTTRLDTSKLVSMQLQSVRSYCEVLFPEQKFSSRRRHSHYPDLWTPILDELSSTTGYTEFCDFVQKLVSKDLSSNTITTHPWYKTVMDGEAESALRFPLKSSTFPNRVIVSMLANECTIERITCNVGHDQGRQFYLNSPTDSGLLAKLTTSVTSLPDVVNNFTGSLQTNNSSSKSLNTSPIQSPIKPKPVKCSLCNQVITPSTTAWRMRLSPREHQWRLMDMHCRDRLVSVGDFCAFLRHIRGGLFADRPVMDLFVESLHHRRNMFYMRTGALSVFIANDFEQFQRRCQQTSAASEVASDGESESSILYQ